MKQDREYLAALSDELRSEGYEVKAVLAMGDPATEIIKLAKTEPIDLIAMTTHGHRLVADLLHGSRDGDDENRSRPNERAPPRQRGTWASPEVPAFPGRRLRQRHYGVNALAGPR